MEFPSDFNRISDRLPLSSRLSLAAGFGGLLAIMAFAGIDALRVLRQIGRSEDQIRQQFLFRDRALSDIRSNLYLSGTYVRDYLLEPEPGKASTFRASLKQVRGRMESSLVSYARQVERGDTRRYAVLRADLFHYLRSLDPILAWDDATRRERGPTFLRDEASPGRAAMLEIAGRIADTNQRQLNAGNKRAAAVMLAFQSRQTVTLFATLALGLAMAAFSTLKILRLEARAQARYREAAEARRQLTGLSARLVQGQETERRALSRELHDEVGQALSAVLVQLRNLSAGAAIRSEEPARSQVDLIKGLVENTVRVVRNMSLLLRPSMLDDLGLIPALRWQAREVSKHASMDVTVTANLASDDLPDEYKTCIFRVVEEALHNCSQHSHATKVRIGVRQTPGLLSLSIQDDGRGFEVSRSRGLGLLRIEERVAYLGGALEVHSRPDSGTILSIELPFRDGGEDRGIRKSETDSHSVGG